MMWSNVYSTRNNHFTYYLDDRLEQERFEGPKEERKGDSKIIMECYLRALDNLRIRTGRLTRDFSRAHAVGQVQSSYFVLSIEVSYIKKNLRDAQVF